MYVNFPFIRAELSDKITCSDYYFIQLSYGVTHFILTATWILKIDAKKILTCEPLCPGEFTSNFSLVNSLCKISLVNLSWWTPQYFPVTNIAKIHMPYVKSYVTIHKNVQHITQNITSNRPNIMDKDILKVAAELPRKRILREDCRNFSNGFEKKHILYKNI